MNENIEEEISRWSGFAKALRKEDREAFEKLKDAFRCFASESSTVANPVIFGSMIMSIMLSQQLRIRQLDKQLNDLLYQRNREANRECEEEKHFG